MAVMSTTETKMESTLADINRNIQEINLSQLHQYVRLGRLEKEIKSMQQIAIELAGSSAKDPAPVEFEED